MNGKKSIGFGMRGWMLIIYQAIAYVTYQVFTNYPLNILSGDVYQAQELIASVYSISAIVGVFVQLLLAGVIAKIKNVKLFGSVLGLVTLALGAGIMCIPYGTPWLVCYAIENVVAVLYATFSIGILVGQWFPTRKGTVMGIATLAFPIANGLIGPFASSVFGVVGPNPIPGFQDVMPFGPTVLFGDQMPIIMAFLPFMIVFIIGWVIGLIFIKDYPEQCGAYRDNDKTMTPEIAKQMMIQEIENKRTSVWTLPHTLTCRDFWFEVIPVGALLMFSVGMMTQTNAIIASTNGALDFIGGFDGVMLFVMIFGCVGSLLLGVIDTRIGTKKAVAISVCIMIVAGILGATGDPIALFAAIICLALFMGASSNFAVSMAAQYWRREDFSSVFASSSPIGNIICSSGPMVIAFVLFNPAFMPSAEGVMPALNGVQGVFLVTLGAGIISLICILLFSPKHLKKVDDKYRAKAGKPIDDELLNRK